MGVPMSKRLKRAGYDLHVYDVDPRPVTVLEELGAHRGETPKDLSSQVDVVISMLPSPKITREVVLGDDGIIHGLRLGCIYIDMSTSSPMLSRELCRVLKESGRDMLDAPVSGGIKGATEGSLTVMVGGDRQVFEKVEDILSCMGSNVVHVGNIGDGHTIKVINNMLFAVNMAATSEALALGMKAGVDPKILRDVMNSSSGRSYALDVKVRDFVFPRNFEAGFAVELQNKDTDLALELAKDVGVPMILSGLVRQLYQMLVVKGYGRKDTSVIATLFEELMQSGEIRP